MGKKTEPQGGIASCTENQRRKRETYLGRTIRQTGIEARYDQAAKELLASREVLAMILQGVVREYEGCNLKQIEDCIEGEPVIGREAVHRGDPGRIQGLPGEDGSLLEGTVYYDVLFQARVPGIGEETDPIRLIINLGNEETGSGLLRFLEVLFSDETGAEQKKEIIEQEYGLKMSRETEGRVEHMCNLSQGVLEKGFTEGEMKKAKEMAFSLAEMGIPVEKIAQAAKVSAKVVEEWLSGRVDLAK